MKQSDYWPWLSPQNRC